MPSSRLNGLFYVNYIIRLFSFLSFNLKVIYFQGSCSRAVRGNCLLNLRHMEKIGTRSLPSIGELSANYEPPLERKLEWSWRPPMSASAQIWASSDVLKHYNLNLKLNRILPLEEWSRDITNRAVADAASASWHWLSSNLILMMMLHIRK
jgi:hypothetical protein